MIIQRLDRCYEVMRQLSSTSRMSEFLCQESQSQKTYLLVRIEESTLAKRFTQFLEEKVRGTEFPDYVECFQSEGNFFAAFTYSQNRTLADKLNADNCTGKEKAEMVRSLLEQLLLRKPHPYFMRNALRPEMITVDDSLSLDWNYHLDEVMTFDYCTMDAVCQRLADVVKLLFEEELERKQFPLLTEYFLLLEEGKMSDYLELYQEFMPVYEALCEEGKDNPPQTFLKRLLEGCRKIADKPDSLKGYLRLGKRYVAKKLALVAILLSVFLSLCLLWILYPWVQSRFLPKTMVIHSQEMEGYTGKVRLVGDLETDNVIFAGTLTEGRINGQGTLYDWEGNLRYQGEFVADQYDGTGKLYDETGMLIYEGSFSQGVYQGSGLLYQSGELLYQGGFSGGFYEGSGTVYYPNGNIRYRGSFSQGVYEGVGALFYENGVTLYEGEFFQGKKSGSGKLYEKNGELLYDGVFSQDRYEGEGTLYDNGQAVCQGSFHLGVLVSGDAVFRDKRGNLIYQGSIINGLYDGQGKLFADGILIYEGGFSEGNYQGSGRKYQEATGRLLYDGMFEQGEYSGEGRLYDGDTGGLLYEGSFYQSLYDGQGKLYDPVCGYLIYDGNFRESQYDGQGKSYAAGMLAYEGEFLLGAYNGRGTLYDQTTGAVVFEGVFYNNQPMAAEPADSEQAAELVE